MIDYRIDRLKIECDKYPPLSKTAFADVRVDDIRFVLKRLEKLTNAIEDFIPTNEGDAEWKDETLS